MNFKPINNIVYSWAKQHGLRMYTQYQDAEVRSTDIVDSLGNKYQIWLEDEGNANYIVNLWNYRKRREKLVASVTNLRDKLDEAYNLARRWMESAS